ncbi:MAG TPA: hypothetical protein VM580_20640 [Labilithrix sp.]|nr:hypothetical protein [Labilithrix sp.]
MGVLVLATVDTPEWHVRVDDVPSVRAFCHGDVVAVDAAGAPLRDPSLRRFLRVVERGGHQPSLRVTHSLSDATAVDAWLEGLEHAGWRTRDDGRGVVWVAAPVGVDARAVLQSAAWVTAVDSPA